MKTRNNIIILLLILVIIILSVNISYAKISNILPLSTIDSSMRFNIQFENAKLEKSEGLNANKNTIKVSNDKYYLTLDGINLEYPGAGAEFSADISNNGNIPAKINSINLKGLEKNCFIKVEVLNKSSLYSKILMPNQKQTVHFTVIWDKNWTENVNNKVETFNLSFEYVQVNV